MWKVMTAVVLLALALIGAWRLIAPTFLLKYKLTIEIEDNGKPYRGSGVVQVDYQIIPKWVPQNVHVQVDAIGEAIPIKISDRGVIFALLGGSYAGRAEEPEAFALRSFGLAPSIGSIDAATFSRVAGRGTPIELPLDRCPPLVRFANLAAPSSAIAFPATDLGRIFDSAVLLKRLSIEKTDAPVTRGVISLLPWLERLRADSGSTLTGSSIRRGPELLVGNFIRN